MVAPTTPCQNVILSHVPGAGEKRKAEGGKRNVEKQRLGAKEWGKTKGSRQQAVGTRQRAIQNLKSKIAPAADLQPRFCIGQRPAGGSRQVTVGKGAKQESGNGTV